MAGLPVRIGHLYPDLNLTGDRGNVIALEQRSRWHGFSPVVTAISLEDQLDLSQFDLLCLAAGQDRQLDLIVDDLRDRKGTAFADAIASGVIVLVAGGAFPALGQQYVSYSGEVRAGLGLFHMTTEPAPSRAVGNAAVHVDTGHGRNVLVGFENHASCTRLGHGVKPLGRVLSGYGNNGEDGTEGLHAGNVYGTHLHGPILPRNPWFADHLLAAALRRRYQDAPLKQLDDRLEEQARHEMLQRLGHAGERFGQ